MIARPKRGKMPSYVTRSCCRCGVPKDHMWPEDASIALTYFELAAHALGVGACWGGFLTAAIRNFEGLRDYLGIGCDEHVCGAQMFGYPLLRPARQYPTRKPLDISWIK